jgi:hypothetical protein
MKKLLALTVCLFAAGCTDADWNHVMNFGGDQDMMSADAPVVVPAAVAEAPFAPAAASNADFCRSVATQDAARNDFDLRTQRSVFARSYAQCLAMYTR